jgi:hypothetical protein
MVTALLVLTSGGEGLGPGGLAYLVLASNSAHFASSTVRLYTKPGTYESLPFLTRAFPLLTLAALTLCVMQASLLGPHLQALYLTWSPFHYAAQAYGLAVMYSYRSGCRLDRIDKRLLWWVSMLPFFYNFLAGQRVGLDWLAPAWILAAPPLRSALSMTCATPAVAAFVAPVLLFGKLWRGASRPLPLISVLVLVSNAVWWFVLSPLDAFIWATIFHGLQYLAVVQIFHLRDQMSRPGNRHGRGYHLFSFYGASLLLGYGLFHCLPLAYVLAGFGLVESTLLVAATINIHHFIVDAFIWRLGQGDGNRKIVEEGMALPLREEPAI